MLCESLLFDHTMHGQAVAVEQGKLLHVDFPIDPTRLIPDYLTSVFRPRLCV
jgi:hypothetical protein